MSEIVEIQAEMMKTFAHPARLQIIKSICKSEQSASDILKATKLSKANLSQHMKLLTGSGIVKSRKSGVNVFYSVSNSKISKACMLMQEIALDNLKDKTKLLK